MQNALAGAVLTVDGSGAPGTFATIGAALAQWVADGGPDGLIRIQDNRTYQEALAVDTGLAGGTFLAIEAADGFRPHLLLAGPLVVAGNRPDFTLTLGGLLVEGWIDLQGSLRGLRLIHTTLVPVVSIAEPDPSLPPPPPPPVQPSLQVAGADAGGTPLNTELTVALAFTITGALRIPDHAQRLYTLDSIVDGAGIAAIAGPGASDAAGPPLHLERTTIRGTVRARQIDLATEVIFDGLATSQRTQIGCVRFSLCRAGSQVPRRYRCQPDLAEADALDAAYRFRPADPDRDRPHPHRGAAARTADLHRSALRPARLPAAGSDRPGRDRNRRRGWLGNGRLLPSEAAAARSQSAPCVSANTCRSVSITAWSTNLKRGNADDERRLHEVYVRSPEALFRRPDAAGAGAARCRMERSDVDLQAPHPRCSRSTPSARSACPADDTRRVRRVGGRGAAARPSAAARPHLCRRHPRRAVPGRGRELPQSAVLSRSAAAAEWRRRRVSRPLGARGHLH